MDLLDLLKKNVSELPEGDHVLGFRAVVRHIEAAEAHLSRGRQQPDDLAFTDAIYRSNQAFEGSLKEGYRVLAKKDPADSTPAEIEKYLQKNNVFRDRVLSQFKSYRTDWRNPSTHDYTLDFDEDEALLAIMSVSVFAKLLVDQVSEQLTFESVKQDLATRPPVTVRERSDPAARVAEAVLSFAQTYIPSAEGEGRSESEAKLVGSLSAYLASALPDVTIAVEAPLGSQMGRRRVDLLAEDADHKRVFVEMKRGRNALIVRQGIDQLVSLIAAASDEPVSGGVLFVVGETGDRYIMEQVGRIGDDAGLLAIVPAPLRLRP